MYKYEPVKQALDDYSQSDSSKLLFTRAYTQLKGVIYVNAAIERLMLSKSPEEALATAWEDVEPAFKGRGEMVLIGAVLGIWDAVLIPERSKFDFMLASAFREADELTDPSYDRRYGNNIRNNPIKRPDDVWNMPVPVPVNGSSMLTRLIEKKYFKATDKAIRDILDEARPELYLPMTTKARRQLEEARRAEKAKKTKSKK